MAINGRTVWPFWVRLSQTALCQHMGSYSTSQRAAGSCQVLINGFCLGLCWTRVSSHSLFCPVWSCRPSTSTIHGAGVTRGWLSDLHRGKTHETDLHFLCLSLWKPHLTFLAVCFMSLTNIYYFFYYRVFSPYMPPADGQGQWGNALDQTDSHKVHHFAIERLKQFGPDYIWSTNQLMDQTPQLVLETEAHLSLCDY